MLVSAEFAKELNGESRSRPRERSTDKTLYGLGGSLENFRPIFEIRTKRIQPERNGMESIAPRATVNST